MLRLLSALVVLSALGSTALAQPVNLTEKAAVGDRLGLQHRHGAEGEPARRPGGEETTDPPRSEGLAHHRGAHACRDRWDWRVPRRASTAMRWPRSSSPARRPSVPCPTIAGSSSPAATADGLTCFAPAGPLTRDELDLVTEHFNPQCLPGLLPGKVVTIGDTWTLSDNAVQAACLFHGVLKNALTGKLTAVKDGMATFTHRRDRGGDRERRQGRAGDQRDRHVRLGRRPRHAPDLEDRRISANRGR